MILRHPWRGSSANAAVLRHIKAAYGRYARDLDVVDRAAGPSKAPPRNEPNPPSALGPTMRP